MSYPEVTHIQRRIDFSVPIGAGAPEPGLLDPALLAATDHLIVLRCGVPPYLAVLGVPHQAAAGAVHICDSRRDAQGRPHPRRADENAALYALAAFEALARRGAAGKLVIMAHATTHDPNKTLDSPYCTALFAEPARLLFECHGAGSSRPLDLELSAGRNHLVDGPSFGQVLARALGGRYSLGVQQRPGERAALIFADGLVRPGLLALPAHGTHSLAEAGRRGLPALHLEARPRFRQPAPGSARPTADGLRLGQAIAESLLQGMD